MDSFHFFIESPIYLSSIDFKNLRNLYLPLIGSTAIVLYEYLCDISEVSSKKIFKINFLIERFQINLMELDESFSKLEAVGLIKRFLNNEKQSIIFILNSPTDIEAINKNPLLKSHLIKIIGLSEYENIYFSNKNKFINKTNYIDVSKKYQEVFPELFNENLNSDDDDQYITSDLVVKPFVSHKENIAKLPSTHFVKYITKRNCSFYEKQMINSLLKMGFSDSSINALIDFSIKFNQAIICPYIIKIAEDFLFRSIVEFNDVSHELSIVESLKLNNKKIKKENKWNFYSSFNEDKKNIDIINEQDLISTTKEISINDIFSDDDIKGIF